MGYYEEIGRMAGEDALDEIESKGITDPAEKWNVHKEHLGGAVAKATLATVLTPFVFPALLGWGLSSWRKRPSSRTSVIIRAQTCSREAIRGGPFTTQRLTLGCERPRVDSNARVRSWRECGVKRAFQDP